MYQLNGDEATDRSGKETKEEDPKRAEDWLLAAIKAAEEGELRRTFECPARSCTAR